MKPAGVLRNSLRPKAMTPAYTASISTANRTMRAVSQPYPCDSASKPRLKYPKNACTGRIHQRGSAVSPAWGFSSSAHMAGDRVSETISEITVAPAMVSANWR